MSSHRLEPRHCLQDGKRFTPKRKDQVFCGKKCQRAAVSKRYHLSKYLTGEDKRAGYSVRKLRELLTDRLQRSEYLDAMAAYVESVQQIARWQKLEQLRRDALAKLEQPQIALRCIVLHDGEPPPPSTEEENSAGVSSTDGLLAVVAYGRPRQ